MAGNQTVGELVDPVDVLTHVVPRLYRILRASLDEDPDLPSLEQLRVMNRIAEGVRYASALAAARQMRMSAITPLIEALVGRRWVTRGPEPGDRRLVRLELTADGEVALSAGRAKTDLALRDVLGHGESDESTAEVAQVAAWLDRAVRRYDEQRLAANRRALT